MVSMATKNITSGCTGQIFAVIFCAKARTKAAIKNLLGEPGVKFLNHHFSRISFKQVVRSNNKFFSIKECANLHLSSFVPGASY
jgi:hypothetical protein